MKKQELNQAFERMTPTTIQRERMLMKIMENKDKEVTTQKKPLIRHLPKIAAAAVCLLLVFTLALLLPGEQGSGIVAYAIYNIGKDGTAIRMSGDGEDETALHRLAAGMPELDFYIEGENIQKIEIFTANEYITVIDWTGTQDSRYDPSTQVAWEDIPFEQEAELRFGEGFRDYGEIWYRWTALDLWNWACGDDYAHIYGYQESLEIDLDQLTDEEKLALASGDQTNMGHVMVDEYPGKLEEEITLQITDQSGNTVTRTIMIRLASNDLLQTVIEAYVK